VVLRVPVDLVLWISHGSHSLFRLRFGVARHLPPSAPTHTPLAGEILSGDSPRARAAAVH
jgi:hypothetical protein